MPLFSKPYEGFSSTVFHLEENIISQGPELPVAIFHHSMIDIEDYISMIIGGLIYNPYENFNLEGRSRTLTAQTFYYNHKKNSWSEGSALNHARFYHAVGIAIDEETKEKLVIVTGGSISDTM